MRPWLTTFVIASAFIATSALGDASILKGLNSKTLKVTIDNLDSEARSAGITAPALKKIVTQRLQRRGLGVLNVGDAELFVRVVVLTSRTGTGEILGFGGHVELSFRESALLKRSKNTEFMGQTWFKAAVAVANKKDFPREVANNLAGLTDQFVSDYLQQNLNIK